MFDLKLNKPAEVNYAEDQSYSWTF